MTGPCSLRSLKDLGFRASFIAATHLRKRPLKQWGGTAILRGIYDNYCFEAKSRSFPTPNADRLAPFDASGDLTQRVEMYAIYHLARDLLSPTFRLSVLSLNQARRRTLLLHRLGRKQV